MSCLNPLVAIDTVNKDGVVVPKIYGRLSTFSDIKLLRSLYGDKLKFIPCGKCISCVRDIARMWQLRIMCESLYHKYNYFITLTYSENPPIKPLKSSLRHFIKSVRYYYGKNVKFFGCGELGSLKSRSHYHIILMLDKPIDDLVFHCKNGLNDLYTSDFIETIWGKGFCTVGLLDVESAGYVAKYNQKKRFDNKGEFILMSRGLGLQYVKDNFNHLLDSDCIFIKGNKFKLPRYFIDKFLQLSKDSEKVNIYKKRKENRAVNFRFNSCTSLTENTARIFKKDILEDKILKKEVNNRDVI